MEFDARHRQIARILGPEGLRVPKGGEERLVAGLTALAPVLTIHSDIAGPEGGAESVPADPRPHAASRAPWTRAWPWTHVHPFGGFGPQLRPGQGRATLLAERDRQAVRCARDLEAGLAAARGLLERCPALLGGAGWEWTLDDLDLALGALEQLHALGEAVVLDWPAGRPIGLTREAQVGQMRVAIRQRRDWLEIEGGLTLEGGRILAMQELLKLCTEAKGRYVPLGEGQFLVLSQALRRRLEGLRGLTDGGRFHPLAAPAIEETVAGMALSAAPAWKGLLRRLAEMQDLEPQVPSTLQAELRDYQVEGYRWLARLAHWGAGACLADDMGLGKTLQALALILARAPQGPTLVVAPTVGLRQLDRRGAALRTDPATARFGTGDRAGVLERGRALRPASSRATGSCRPRAKRLAEVALGDVVARRGPGHQECRRPSAPRR